MNNASGRGVRRRSAMSLGATWLAVPWLPACGGGGGGNDPVTPQPQTEGLGGTGGSGSGTTGDSTSGGTAGGNTSGTGGGAATVPGSAYRTGQRYLFQSVGTASYASTLGGSAYSTDVWGPTHVYVDFATGWKWEHPGGDWLDADLVAQGARPWVSIRTDAVAGGSAVHTYQNIDATALVQHCQQQGRWMAWMVRSANAPRSIAGLFAASGLAPALAVTYIDGRTAQLRCRLTAVSSSSSTLPLSARASLPLPAFLEFEPPDAPVASATMSLTVTEHWSGNGVPQVNLFLCDPPLNRQPQTGTGALASRASPQDAGIASVPGVIGAQRYVDGTRLEDFVVPGAANITAERGYDPALWGGPQDLGRWPHTAQGKWLNPPAGLSLVNSQYRGEGFEPLAPGLGALRLFMPDSGVLTGQEGGSLGSTAANTRLLLPFEDMGLLDRIFVRYYMRLGLPLSRTPADRREVRQSGLPSWTTLDGKCGIAPSHWTSYGGNSGSSGGGMGWQMRQYWAECDAAQGGPDEGGAILGWHLYDFQNANPVGHRYGFEGQNTNNWGQIGGMGAVVYAGRWYCIETEVKLNSVDATDNSYRPDGALRTWIDGQLCHERTGMVFRTLPMHAPAANPDLMRPMRQLGIKDLWWNWFHGGRTQSSVDRTTFVTGLVWARERIGLMV